EWRYVRRPLDFIETGSRVPPVYQWLATQPRDGAVVEIPLTVDPRRNEDPSWQQRYAYFARGLELSRGGFNLAELITQARYVYFSTYHRHWLVHRERGDRPPLYHQLGRALPRVPHPAGVG